MTEVWARRSPATRMVNVRPAGAALVAGAVGAGAALVAGSVGARSVGAAGAAGTLGAACWAILGRTAVTEITAGTAVTTVGAAVDAAVGGATSGAYAAAQLHAARLTDAATPARRAPLRTLTMAEGMALLSRGVGSLRPDAASARPWAGQADSRSRSAVPGSDDGTRTTRATVAVASPTRGWRRARRGWDRRSTQGASRRGTRRGPAVRRGQRRGQRGHPEEATDVPEDPLVDLRGVDDRGRGQRPREVDVGSLQPLHGLVVPRDVVLHPRPDVLVTPVAERLADRDRVGAAVQQIQECADLHAGHRHASTDGRGGGRHRVADGHQARDALLLAVDVAQATTDEHVGRRRGTVRVRPGRERGDGAARRFERVAVTEPLQGDVGGRPDDDDGEVAVLVGKTMAW